MVDRISGKRHVKIPIAKPIATAFATIHLKRAEWFGVYPQITPPWVRVFLADWAYRSDKAARELGYAPRSLEKGLQMTYQWLEGVRRGGA
jgi:nucleoside-diphosphate-sugar epimerase